MSRLAEETIAARAYEARMEAIGRHFSLRRELTGQKYLLESALITAAPEQRPALLRMLINVVARLIVLEASGAPAR